MPNGPKLTEKDLEEHGFGPRPFYECLVAFEPSNPDVLIGFVLFFYTYSTWEGPSVFMEDLNVTLSAANPCVVLALPVPGVYPTTMSLQLMFPCTSHALVIPF